MTDHPNAGDRDIFSNWVCQYCGTLNSRKDTKCRKCERR